MHKKVYAVVAVAVMAAGGVSGQVVSPVGELGELTLTEASKAVGGDHDISWTYNFCRLSTDGSTLTVENRGQSTIKFKANDFTHAMLKFSAGTGMTIGSKAYTLGDYKTLTIPLASDASSLSMEAGEEPFSLESITFAERLSSYLSLAEWEAARPTELTGINEPLLVNFARGNMLLVSTLSGGSPLLIENAPEGISAGDVIESLTAGTAAADECITMAPDNLTFALADEKQTPLLPQTVALNDFASCAVNQYVKLSTDGLTLSAGEYQAGEVSLINPFDIQLEEGKSYDIAGIVRSTPTEMHLLVTAATEAVATQVVTTIDLTDYRLAQYDSKDASYSEPENGILTLKEGAPATVSKDGVTFTTCGNNSAYLFEGKIGCTLGARNAACSPQGFTISCGSNDEILSMIVDADGELRCDTGNLESTGETYMTSFLVTRYKWTPTVDGTKSVSFERLKASLVGIPKIEVTHKISGTPTSLTNVGASTAAAPRYYDMSGHQVENPAPGLYIRVAGRDAEKVLLQ